MFIKLSILKARVFKNIKNSLLKTIRNGNIPIFIVVFRESKCPRHLGEMKLVATKATSNFSFKLGRRLAGTCIRLNFKRTKVPELKHEQIVSGLLF